jgi:hypothetical protein
MNILTQEIEFMQNPALGALLLWRFTKAYSDAHPENVGPKLPLVFLVLPLLWNTGTSEPLAGTRTASGLRFFAAKFSKPSASSLDVLASVQDRAIRWREKTAASLRMSIATGLLELADSARVRVRSNPTEPTQNRTVSDMVDGAEKLGVWLAPLSVDEISLILHVRF